MGNKIRIINIFTKGDAISEQTKAQLTEKLEQRGFSVSQEYDDQAELNVTIGGDGSFLRALRKTDYVDIPWIGINTGHLGFFEELQPEDQDFFLEKYEKTEYVFQELPILKAVARNEKDGSDRVYKAVNEIVIRGENTRSVHLDISVGLSPIQKFSGDGVLICTPAGSTAYNYALGGSILDPRLQALQVTPLSPMNTIAYRSFTSSVILPAYLSVGVRPEKSEPGTLIVADGMVKEPERAECIEISLSEEKMRLIRFSGYDFWHKVKSKFF